MVRSSQVCVKGHVCLEAGLIGRNMRIVWHVPLCSLAQSACELTVRMINVPAGRDHEQSDVVDVV